MRAALALAPLFWLACLNAAFADARISVLTDVLRLSEATAILSDEGVAYAQDLNTDMLDGQGGPGWQVQVQRIYDPARMAEVVRERLEAELQGDLLEEVIAFYASDLGDRIVSLENSARVAIRDDDIEEAARARFAELEGTDDPRFAAITRYIAAGDMIDRNVTSAMNSNLHFMRGLVDGKAMEMSEEEILADVAGDLEETTEDTTAWLYGYLLLAYHPLTQEEMARYIAFAETEAGKALNRALFDGFGNAYVDISYALGRAVALNMTGQDI